MDPKKQLFKHSMSLPIMEMEAIRVFVKRGKTHIQHSKYKIDWNLCSCMAMVCYPHVGLRENKGRVIYH